MERFHSMRGSRCPIILWASLLAIQLCGCAAVKPWEKEKLASPCMANPFGKTALTAGYEDKLTQTKTAGGLPGDAPGGGCGCVQ